MSGLRRMSVEGCEVKFSGNQKDNGAHRGESSIAAGLAFRCLKQPVDGFEKAIGLARLDPRHNPSEMLTNHPRHRLHGRHLGAHDLCTPLTQHRRDDMNLLARKNLPFLGSVLGVRSCNNTMKSWPL